MSDHNGIKPEINNGKIAGKSQDICKLNNTLLNNIWVKEAILREILKYFELNKTENITSHNIVGGSKSNF